MDVVDAVTLKITLKAKNAVFPRAVDADPVHRLARPPSRPRAAQVQQRTPSAPARSLLKSWTRDSQMVFVRNPNYWNAPLPYVDQLIIKPIADETQRINTFMRRAGQHAPTSGAVTNADQLQKQPCGTIQPDRCSTAASTSTSTPRQAPFNDIRAPPGHRHGHRPQRLLQGRQRRPDRADRLDLPHDSPFYDPTILQPAYDPVKAQQLFDQVAADNGGTISLHHDHLHRC